MNSRGLLKESTAGILKCSSPAAARGDRRHGGGRRGLRRHLLLFLLFLLFLLLLRVQLALAAAAAAAAASAPASASAAAAATATAAAAAALGCRAAAAALRLYSLRGGLPEPVLVQRVGRARRAAPRELAVPARSLKSSSSMSDSRTPCHSNSSTAGSHLDSPICRAVVLSGGPRRGHTAPAVCPRRQCPPPALAPALAAPPLASAASPAHSC